MGLNKSQLDLLKQLIGNLDDTQKENIANLLNAKNNNLKNTNNQIVVLEECPHCHSKHFVKFGKYKNSQKYFCKDCHTHFRTTENTILKKSRKDISVWNEYIKCMLDKKSLRDTAEICGISLQTSFIWRHKILDILAKAMNNTKLNGIIESDETYTAVSYKGNHTKSRTGFVLPRKPHK